ncbi:peptidase inhibitor family I36 protein [Nonomuraea sp. NPDC050786]|uniref:peptidase inhibitor family I36 protein n=1 Tax=Nonomuraea sp. NPDC050786 TaxID=3154840 RepID=UPI0033D3CE62
MKRLAITLSAGLSVLALTTTPASAGHDGFCDYAIEDGNVCLYRDANFSGGMLDFTRSDRNYTSAADVFFVYPSEPGTVNVNDQVSSIVNYEGYCEWWFYTDAEYGGVGFKMLNINQSYNGLGSYNDALSSHYKWTGWTECTNGSTG